MATSYASELLIRIAADPSNAEASIRSFRAEFAQGLGELGGNLSAWSQRGFGDFARVRSAALDLRSALTLTAQAMPPLNASTATTDRTMQNLAAHFRVNLSAIDDAFHRNGQAVQFWKTTLAANFAEALSASDALNASLLRSFVIFDTALGANVANAVIWQRSIGEAFRKAVLQAIGSIAQEALVRAVYATALGFYLLAVQDYRGAALAFKSAATFGIIGGAAAVAGRALAGPDIREGERGATVRSPEGVAPELIVSGGSRGSPQASSAQPTLQVIFQGPVYGGQAGIDELVRHISQAVSDRDVNLVAYTVVRQPTTRA